MYELQQMLGEIGGCDAVTLQPAAGAHGEFTGLLLARAFHEANGEGHRSEVILPDTAHGTNPASAIMAGYKVVEIKSGEDGCVDLSNLDRALSENTAIFMLTNPNTLGIFEHDVLEISKMMRKAGGLLYYDGANLNAIMGRARPGDMGYDIVHFNLHKTFATPHGGGGPGGGPIGVSSNLEEFLPVPIVAKTEDRYYLDYDRPKSIGKIKSYYGNFGVMVKAYTYIKMLGAEGLRQTAEIATLNSNYMKEKLKGHYSLPHKDLRKHEFVLSGSNLKSRGVRTMDVAKRLMDYGYHAPTVYFPLIVDEALMVEPTESEPKEELDGFIQALKLIAEEPEEVLHGAPHSMPVRRIDEVWAAKHMILSYRAYLAEKEKMSEEEAPVDPQIIGK
jgi:glycine dehydrogenase subunit 2